MQLRQRPSAASTRPQVAWHLPSAPLPLRTRRDTAVRFKEGEATAVQLKEQPAKQRRKAEVIEDEDSRPEAAESAPGFAWTKQWYPVRLISYLDTSVVNEVKLLGESVAVWRNPVTGTWACVEDRCPHRAAPLSQGQVIKTTGELRCAYHGWTFDQQGKCTDVPASATPERICNMRGSCVPSRPVREAHGILWVWGESGPQAHMEAAKTPLPTDGLEEFNSPEWVNLTPWTQRFIPVSFPTIIDNGLDLAHTPFVHHGRQGFSRDKAARGFSVKPGPTQTLEKGVTATIGPVSTSSKTDITYTYHPPGLIRLRVTAPNGSPAALILLRAPIGPGQTVSMGTTALKSPPAIFRLIFNLVPKWVLHLREMTFGEQDYIILHNQDRLVEQQGGPSKAFFIPDPTDAALSELMVWFKKAGPIPYPQGQKLPPRLPKEQVLERYNAHVAHCKHCQQGLATLRLVTVLAGLAAGLLAAAAAAQAAVAVVSPVAVPALPWLAVAAVVLGWVGWSAYKLQKRFFVGDCDHRRS